MRSPAGSRAPGPRGLEAFRAVRRLRCDAFAALEEGIDRHGDIVRYPMGLSSVYFLRHPDHVQYILETNHANFRRSDIYARMGPLLGRGLLTADGDHWRRHRVPIQKGFSRKRLESFIPLVVRSVDELLEEWSIHARSGKPFDLASDMMTLSLTLAGQIMFTADIRDEAKNMWTYLPPALEELDLRFKEILVTPSWIPTPRNRRFHEAVRYLDDLVNRLIRDRQASRAARTGDILDMLLDCRYPDTGEPLPPGQVRDEVMTLLLTGHETIANHLAWTFYLIAAHPEEESRLLAETTGVLNGDDPTPETIRDLVRTRQILDESHRIYPAAWGMDRQVVEDDVIGGFTIEAGSIVYFPSYFVHRHPDFWPDAETFDPDRFLPEAVASRHHHAYLPFGAGQRRCIGREMALLNATLIVTRVLSRFHLELVEEGPPVKVPAITLRPRDGVVVRAHPRDRAAWLPGGLSSTRGERWRG